MTCEGIFMDVISSPGFNLIHFLRAQLESSDSATIFFIYLEK